MSQILNKQTNTTMTTARIGQQGKTNTMSQNFKPIDTSATTPRTGQYGKTPTKQSALSLKGNIYAQADTTSLIKVEPPLGFFHNSYSTITNDNLMTHTVIDAIHKYNAQEIDAYRTKNEYIYNTYRKRSPYNLYVTQYHRNVAQRIMTVDRDDLLPLFPEPRGIHNYNINRDVFRYTHYLSNGMIGYTYIPCSPKDVMSMSFKPNSPVGKLYAVSLTGGVLKHSAIYLSKTTTNHYLEHISPTTGSMPEVPTLNFQHTTLDLSRCARVYVELFDQPPRELFLRAGPDHLPESRLSIQPKPQGITIQKYLEIPTVLRSKKRVDWDVIETINNMFQDNQNHANILLGGDIESNPGPTMPGSHNDGELSTTIVDTELVEDNEPEIEEVVMPASFARNAARLVTNDAVRLKEITDASYVVAVGDSISSNDIRGTILESFLFPQCLHQQGLATAGLLTHYHYMTYDYVIVSMTINPIPTAQGRLLMVAVPIDTDWVYTDSSQLNMDDIFRYPVVRLDTARDKKASLKVPFLSRFPLLEHNDTREYKANTFRLLVLVEEPIESGEGGTQNVSYSISVQAEGMSMGPRTISYPEPTVDDTTIGTLGFNKQPILPAVRTLVGADETFNSSDVPIFVESDNAPASAGGNIISNAIAVAEKLVPFLDLIGDTPFKQSDKGISTCKPPEIYEGMSLTSEFNDIVDAQTRRIGLIPSSGNIAKMCESPTIISRQVIPTSAPSGIVLSIPVTPFMDAAGAGSKSPSYTNLFSGYYKKCRYDRLKYTFTSIDTTLHTAVFEMVFIPGPYINNLTYPNVRSMRKTYWDTSKDTAMNVSIPYLYTRERLLTPVGYPASCDRVIQDETMAGFIYVFLKHPVRKNNDSVASHITLTVALTPIGLNFRDITTTPLGWKTSLLQPGVLESNLSIDRRPSNRITNPFVTDAFYGRDVETISSSNGIVDIATVEADTTDDVNNENEPTRNVIIPDKTVPLVGNTRFVPTTTKGDGSFYKLLKTPDALFKEDFNTDTYYMIPVTLTVRQRMLESCFHYRSGGNNLIFDVAVPDVKGVKIKYKYLDLYQQRTFAYQFDNYPELYVFGATTLLERAFDCGAVTVPLDQNHPTVITIPDSSVNPLKINNMNYAAGPWNSNGYVLFKLEAAESLNLKTTIYSAIADDRFYYYPQQPKVINHAITLTNDEELTSARTEADMAEEVEIVEEIKEELGDDQVDTMVYEMTTYLDDYIAENPKSPYKNLFRAGIVLASLATVSLPLIALFFRDECETFPIFNHFALSLLELAGDVESNPGPAFSSLISTAGVLYYGYKIAKELVISSLMSTSRVTLAYYKAYLIFNENMYNINFIREYIRQYKAALHRANLRIDQQELDYFLEDWTIICREEVYPHPARWNATVGFHNPTVVEIAIPGYVNKLRCNRINALRNIFENEPICDDIAREPKPPRYVPGEIIEAPPRNIWFQDFIQILPQIHQGGDDILLGGDIEENPGPTNQPTQEEKPQLTPEDVTTRNNVVHMAVEAGQMMVEGKSWVPFVLSQLKNLARGVAVMSHLLTMVKDLIESNSYAVFARRMPQYQNACKVLGFIKDFSTILYLVFSAVAWSMGDLSTSKLITILTFVAGPSIYKVITYIKQRFVNGAGVENIVALCSIIIGAILNRNPKKGVAEAISGHLTRLGVTDLYKASSEASANLFASYFSDSLPIDQQAEKWFRDNSDRITKFTREWQSRYRAMCFTAHYLDTPSKIPVDCDLTISNRELIVQGEQIMTESAEYIMYARRVQPAFTMMMKQVTDSARNLSRIKRGDEERVEPIGLWVSGAPRGGKSYFTSKVLPQFILIHELKMRKHADYTSDVYAMPTGEDQVFYDGYHGQEYAYIDDLGVLKEDKNVPTIINLISSATAPLNQASLEDKGEKFTSSFLAVTTNLQKTNQGDAMITPEAFNQRFARHAIYYKPTKEYTKKAEGGATPLDMFKTTNRLKKCRTYDDMYEAYDEIVEMKRVTFNTSNEVIKSHKVIKMRDYIADIILDYKERHAVDDEINSIFAQLVEDDEEDEIIEPEAWNNFFIPSALYYTFNKYDVDYCRVLMRQKQYRELYHKLRKHYTDRSFTLIEINDSHFNKIRILEEGLEAECNLGEISDDLLNYVYTLAVVRNGMPSFGSSAPHAALTRLPPRTYRLLYGIDMTYVRTMCDSQNYIDLYHILKDNKFVGIVPTRLGIDGLQGEAVMESENLIGMKSVVDVNVFDAVYTLAVIVQGMRTYANQAAEAPFDESSNEWIWYLGGSMVAAVGVYAFTQYIRATFEDAQVVEAYGVAAKKSKGTARAAKVNIEGNLTDAYDKIRNNCVPVYAYARAESFNCYNKDYKEFQLNVKPNMYCTFIDETHMIVPTHFTKAFEKFSIPILSHTGKLLRFDTHLSSDGEGLIVHNKLTDVTMFRLPAPVPRMRCIRNLIPTSEWFSSFFGVRHDEVKELQYIHPTRETKVTTSHGISWGSAQDIDKFGKTTNHKSLSIKLERNNGGIGFCGVPLIAVDQGIKFVGFHVAGSLSGDYAAVISRSMIEVATKALSNGAPDLPQCNIINEIPLFTEAYTEANELGWKNDTFEVLDYNRRHDGTKYEKFTGGKPSHARTDHANIEWNDGHLPTRRNGKILFDRSQKYGYQSWTQNTIPRKYFDFAVECSKRDIERTLESYTTHSFEPLSELEVLEGRPQNNIKPLDLTTSGGIATDAPGFTKATIFNKVERYDGTYSIEWSNFGMHAINPAYGISTYAEYQRRLDILMSDEGCYTPVWTSTLKPELKPTQKVKDGKTRVFETPDLVEMLLERKFLAPTSSFYRNTGGTLMGHLIGLDKEAVAAGVYEDMHEVGNNGFDVDYKDWDGSIQDFHFRYAYEMRSYMMPKYARPIAKLMRQQHTAYHQIGKFRAMSHKSLASGQENTDTGNTEGNKCHVYAVFAETYDKRFGSLPSYELTKKNVRFLILGDDLWIAASDWVLDFFNRVTFANIMGAYGFVVTAADKSDILVPFETLHEHTFLKTNYIRRSDGVVLLPLDKRVIFRLINWICTNGISSPETQASNLGDALAFSYHHGPEFYNDILSYIRSTPKYKPATLLTYAAMDRFVVKKQGAGTLMYYGDGYRSAITYNVETSTLNIQLCSRCNFKYQFEAKNNTKVCSNCTQKNRLTIPIIDSEVLSLFMITSDECQVVSAINKGEPLSSHLCEVCSGFAKCLTHCKGTKMCYNCYNIKYDDMPPIVAIHKRCGQCANAHFNDGISHRMTKSGYRAFSQLIYKAQKLAPPTNQDNDGALPGVC